MINSGKSNLKKFYFGYIIVFVGIIAGALLLILGGILHADTVTQVILIAFGIALIIVSSGGACVLELSYGSFECPDCGKKFTPSFREYIFAPHTPTKRYLRCPGCGDKKMCKFKLNK